MQVPIKRPRKNTEFRPEYSQGILSRAWKKHNQIIRKSILHKAQHYKPGWTVEKAHLGLLWAFSSATKLKLRSERKHQEKNPELRGGSALPAGTGNGKALKKRAFCGAEQVLLGECVTDTEVCSPKSIIPWHRKRAE